MIGGDPQRWHRRLDGLDSEYLVKIQREAKDDPESSRVARLERDRDDLRHLRAFALPIIDELAVVARARRRGGSGWTGSRRSRRGSCVSPNACCA